MGCEVGGTGANADINKVADGNINKESDSDTD